MNVKEIKFDCIAVEEVTTKCEAEQKTARLGKDLIFEGSI